MKSTAPLSLTPWRGAMMAFAVFAGMGLLQTIVGKHTFGDWLRSLPPGLILMAIFAYSLSLGEKLGRGRFPWRNLCDVVGCLGLAWLYRANFQLGSAQVLFTNAFVGGLSLLSFGAGLAFSLALRRGERRQALQPANYRTLLPDARSRELGQ